MRKKIITMLLICFCFCFSEQVFAEGQMEVQAANPYTDVASNHWYYQAAMEVYDLGYMTGLTPTTFGPTQPIVRAQFATILHRMAGKPGTSAQNIFPDVWSEDWYAPAVIWASEQGIVTGYANGLFGTTDYITREQLITMLYRYACYKGYDTTRKASLSKFIDSWAVNSFSQDAMQWAVANGILVGQDNGTLLRPQGSANRAECATMIQRFIYCYEKKLPTGMAVVAYARQFVGNPYVYGGNSLTEGTDCSGFTKLIYEHFGITIPRTDSGQATVGVEVPVSEARAGDLIVYWGHVGICNGSGGIIHASEPRVGIVEWPSFTYREIRCVRRLIP